MSIRRVVPEHSDLNIVFTDLKRNGENLDFNTVSGWYFSMGPNINSTPVVSFDSVTNSGNFTINPTGRTVSVFVDASALSDGQYFVQLFMQPSGSSSIITHLQTSLTIQKTLEL